MDEILIILKKFLSKAKTFLYEVYNKLLFFFNKQMTLQKMYEPLTKSKNEANKELAIKLSLLRDENILLSKSSEKLAEKNKLIRDKISCLQELLLKK